MSIFASRVTKTIELPQAPGQTVTIRKLAGRQLGKAQQESQFAAIDTMRRMGGVAVQRELQALANEQKKPVGQVEAEVRADPLNLYDHLTLLVSGVLAWTFEEPVTEQTLADLDDDASRLLVTEILRLSRPTLFQTPEEADAAQKND